MATKSNNLYGFPQPLSTVFPPPVIAQRSPTTSDIAYPIGQTWIDEVGDDAYILVDVTAASATWNVMATTPGNVDTLTGDSGGAITPSAGNINILGTANQITTTGSGHQIAFTLPAAITAPGSLTTTTTLTSTTLFTGLKGATINSNGTAIAIGTDNSGDAVSIGTGTVARAIHIGDSAAAHVITIGSATGVASTTIKGGSAGIVLVPTAGNISAAPATGSAASANITLAGRLFQSTHTGLTTASGSSQVFVITNSSITATTSAVLVTAANLGSNDAQMTVTRVVPANGTLTITLKNNGAAALNGDVQINGWILN